MSVSVVRSEGATVLTLTSDSSSVCPPLCQLLGALCYSPRLCSRSRRLVLPRGSQAVLGALWIASGLMQIGLGAILLSTRGAVSYKLQETFCPVWLGVLFMGFGVCCLLTERYSSPRFVLLSGILNLFGVAMSILAIVWYSTQFSLGFYSLCSSDYDYWRPQPTTTPSAQEQALLERCLHARQLLRVLLYGISAALLALAALGLCLGISSAVLSFKALKCAQDKEGSKPLLEEDGTAASEY